MKPKTHDQLLERQLNIRCNIFDILKVPYSRYLPRGIAWDLFLTHSFHEADDVSREVVIENGYLKQQAKLDLNCPWRETHWACLKSQSQRRMVISRGGRCQSSQKKMFPQETPFPKRRHLTPFGLKGFEHKEKLCGSWISWKQMDDESSKMNPKSFSSHISSRSQKKSGFGRCCIDKPWEFSTCCLKIPV